MKPSWSVWLLNRGEEPVCWATELSETEAEVWCVHAAHKVFDGSDADSFMLLRSDMHPDEV